MLAYMFGVRFPSAPHGIIGIGICICICIGKTPAAAGMGTDEPVDVPVACAPGGVAAGAAGVPAKRDRDATLSSMACSSAEAMADASSAIDGGWDAAEGLYEAAEETDAV